MSLLYSCAVCGAQLQKPLRGRPFPDGPHRGRYWCPDCWTLHYDAHPELFGDAVSRKINSEQAARIRAKRAAGGPGSELVFSEGGSNVYLTVKGTVLFHIEPLPWSTADEFDPDRMRTFVKALQAVAKSVPGYEDILSVATPPR